ncbi:molybdopterin dinucleotide binding domain-containing protein, partial [Paracoccus sp. (in: a-proteobacteria)]|uniref:molybdopterin dinucleotide binding domain-containing protein n=1 Tax=Paracoccus sp. TaxID=267 RepID=UPI0026DF9A3B
NPAVTLPEADAVRAAIADCDFVVVSDVTGATDTARLAHVLLPAAAWAEKSGTVTNSDRTISRQRAALPPPGQARPDWWALAQVAQRMGFAGFDWDGPAAIFREHAALSGIAGRLGRDFDISGKAGMSEAEYEAMEPFRWPFTATRRGGRFFADGRFLTPDRRGRMVAVTARPPAGALAPDRPFRLNTGRIRDQWHSMTRTARAPRLNRHVGEPFVEVHPADALRLGLAPFSLAEVSSGSGRAILRVVVTDRIARGQLFAPMHWSGETAPSGRIDALVPAALDPVSGQPESKAAAVALAPWNARWFAFAASERAFTPATPYWARRATETGQAAELAALAPPHEDAESMARALFALPDAELIRCDDPARGLTTLCLVSGGRVRALLFACAEPVTLSRDSVIARIGTPVALSSLAPRAGADQPDAGPILCACMGVGRNRIAAAIDAGARDVAAVAAATCAGTGCGACRPEIAALIAVASVPAMAAE